jgi:hypothetical protein
VSSSGGSVSQFFGSKWATVALLAAVVGASALAIPGVVGDTISSGDCASSTPYAPDSPDPWGDCWPGPESTGVPEGTSLTTYGGSCTITTPDTVIDSKIVNCNSLVISTSGVEITNSQVNGHVAVDSDSYPNAYSFTITDSDIVQGTTRANIHGDDPFGVGKSNFVATRVHITGGIRGAWCEYNCTLQDSYICCQAEDDNGALTCVTPGGTQHSCIHESGARQGSGPDADEGQNFIHNTWTCDAQDFEDPNPGGSDSSGCSATLTGYGDFATIQYNTVYRNNFLETEGGVCIYGGATGGGKPFPNANHQVVQQNIFHGGADQKCGWGFTSTDWSSGGTGNSWSSNSMWNGTVLTPNWSPNQ